MCKRSELSSPTKMTKTLTSCKSIQLITHEKRYHHGNLFQEGVRLETKKQKDLKLAGFPPLLVLKPSHLQSAQNQSDHVYPSYLGVARVPFYLAKRTLATALLVANFSSAR